jgi:hypothetical protein
MDPTSHAESSREVTAEPSEKPNVSAPASKRIETRARRIGQRLSFMNLLAYALVALALLSVFAHRR